VWDVPWGAVGWGPRATPLLVTAAVASHIQEGVGASVPSHVYVDRVSDVGGISRGVPILVTAAVASHIQEGVGPLCPLTCIRGPSCRV